MYKTHGNNNRLMKRINNYKFTNFKDAYNISREHIISGKPFKHLEKIKSV